MFGKRIQRGSVLKRETLIIRKLFELITQNFLSGNWPRSCECDLAGNMASRML